MAKKPNAMDIKNIRASGTQQPGKRQAKKPTKAQAKAQGTKDDLGSRLTRLEKGFEELSKFVLHSIRQELATRALETNVCMEVLGSQVTTRDFLMDLMRERAEHFGLTIQEESQQVGEDNAESSTDESSESNPDVSSEQKFEGAEGYSG